jgi:hypothetical protein
MLTISSGFLRSALATDGGSIEDPQLVGLIALAAGEDAELDAGACLERGHAGGQGR